ncbi:S1 RNA-binding domain-containing protein [Streptomyces krungchingensis]
MPSFVHRITKYDPADRDEHGSYSGSEDTVSDHGPVEAAYLEAVAAFASATGVDRLAVREPATAGLVRFGREPAVDGHGPAGIFPFDLSEFHDGAEISLRAGLELVRAMLRDHGVWCRLEVEGVFAVHVGWDQYVYVGSDRPCEGAVARTRALGLFPERLEVSPYDAEFDEPGAQRPADDEFWARLSWFVAGRQAVLLEEEFVDGASRWHRLDAGRLDGVRAGLAPRARLTVWPDLSADIDAVLATLPQDGPAEVVWEDRDGVITGAIVDETEHGTLAARMADARAAAVLPLDADARHPLFTAVLTDRDGVLRARWRTGQTPSDRDWAFLKTLRRGQTVTGVVTRIASFGVTFVDIGGFTAMINLPELSRRHIAHPSDVVTVGQEISAKILDVDMVRERVSLSLSALADDTTGCGGA